MTYILIAILCFIAGMLFLIGLIMLSAHLECRHRIKNGYKIFLFPLFLMLVGSCNTVQKQQRKAEQFYLLHPEKLAKECAEKFPVDTIYKHGATVVKSDTITVKGDSIPCPPYINAKGDTVFVKVKCPDNKIIHDTIIRIDTIVKANTALAVYLGYQKDSLQNELIKVTTLKDIAEKHAKTRLWILIGIALLAVAGIILKLKKFI